MADHLIPLKGSVPVNHHEFIGPADPNECIEVTIKLRRRSEKGLPTLDEFVAGKRSVGITRQMLLEHYGASLEDANLVQRWAVQQGLSVSRVNLGTRQMHLVGSITAMSRAFGVRLSIYKHLRTKTLFRCPDADIQVPESLAAIITGVFGLNDMPVVVRHGARLERSAAEINLQQQFPGCFYPNEVAKLYNFPVTQGAGERVAALEFGGGFDQGVLASYFTDKIGLKTLPTVNAIFVLGAKMQLTDSLTGEVYLDIEIIGAMAPKATIDVYFAPWTGEGYLNAIDEAIHNEDYAGISISYGLDEDLRGTGTDPGWPMLNQNIDEAFRDATAIGVPLFISTGDQGSSSMRGLLSDGTEITLYSKSAHAGFPATSPYAIAVGGTMLYADNEVIRNEIVWNELGDLQQGKFYYGGATGGGVSDRYKKVPSYQKDAGIVLASGNSPPAQGRCIPDVAGNAGTSTGYLVSQPPGSPYPIGPVGGTSAAAPMWAALMACIRESLNKTFNGKVPVFFLNDFIYANGKTSAFRDITGGREFTIRSEGLIPGRFIPVGNNRSTDADGYYAKKGYDLCTGWGSPNGNELLKVLETWLTRQRHS
jgi:kumamolisin